MFELVHVTTGMDVLSVDAPGSEHGLSMIDPVSGRVVIAVATTAHPMRQRSSIAHELGHVVAGDLDDETPLVPGDRSSVEVCADAFARHLLIPLHALHRRLPRDREVSLSDISALVQEFGVSAAMAAIQARTVGRINAQTCSAWGGFSAGRLAATFGWLGQYRALASDSAAPRAPQALMTRAVEGYHRGVLGIAELASWYGQSPEALAEELRPPPSAEESDVGIIEWDQDAPLFPPLTVQGEKSS